MMMVELVQSKKQHKIHLEKVEISHNFRGNLIRYFAASNRNQNLSKKKRKSLVVQRFSILISLKFKFASSFKDYIGDDMICEDAKPALDTLGVHHITFGGRYSCCSYSLNM